MGTVMSNFIPAVLSFDEEYIEDICEDLETIIRRSFYEASGYDILEDY